MTNRSKRGKSGNSMRFLDLSFDGDKEVTIQGSPINNGFRPHGGYRGIINYKMEKRGTKSHPPSIFSFDQPSEYHEALQKDLDHLIGAQSSTGRIRSPSWAIRVAREKNHSGESPLFVHQLLAPSRSEATDDNAKAFQQSNSRPSSSKRYYRPNSTHQYLTVTELKDATKGQVNPKLGKPTRTTLLRARQRCNSAPVNAYNERRERLVKAEERADSRQSMADRTTLTIQDLLRSQHGESLHSFLIGARYNRAHCLDAKSYDELGVYMPRNNPLGCFIRKKDQDQNKYPPKPPPDTPASGSDDEDYAPPPRSRPQQAWADGITIETEKAGPGIMERHINMDDGLNVKGTGMSSASPVPSARPRSSRTASARSVPVSLYSERSSHPRSNSLPSVQVQGTAIGRSARCHDPIIDQALLANEPSSPRPMSPDHPPSSPVLKEHRELLNMTTSHGPPYDHPEGLAKDDNHSNDEEEGEEEVKLENEELEHSIVVEDEEQQVDKVINKEHDTCEVEKTLPNDDSLAPVSPDEGPHAQEEEDPKDDLVSTSSTRERHVHFAEEVTINGEGEEEKEEIQEETKEERVDFFITEDEGSDLAENQETQIHNSDLDEKIDDYSDTEATLEPVTNIVISHKKEEDKR